MDTTASPEPGHELPTADLETLTDEELAVLSTVETVPVTPHLSEIPPPDRHRVVETAYRGLVARGIITPPDAQARAAAREDIARAETAGRTTHGIGIPAQIREDVASIITLRQEAQTVVALARTFATWQDFTYLHVVDDVLLMEVVTSDGLHHFALRHREHLSATVLEAALHPEAGGVDGEPLALPVDASTDPSPPQELLEDAGEALMRCDVVVVGRPEILGLFTAPTASWLFRTVFGSGEPVQVHPTSPVTLRAAVSGLLRDAGL